MTSPNEHISDYLSHYVSLQYPPRYAVLLSGSWGIGKTFTVKKCLDQLSLTNTKRKHVYLSLFGLTSTSEIDDALIAAIYPALQNSALRATGKLLKAGLKFIGKDLQLKPSDILAKMADCLYIFDDLERCEVPAHVVLGYINTLIEHEDNRVIILANEREIRDQNEYRRRREKVIGKTLEVQPSIDQALSFFLGEIRDAEAKATLLTRREELERLCTQSQLNNLRLVQQSLWDFERFFRAVPSKHREHKQAMAALLRVFFVFSLEFKHGRVNQEDLRHRTLGIVSARIDRHRDDKETQNNLRDVLRRYPDAELEDDVVTDDVLANALIAGVCKPVDIASALDKSSYFTQPPNVPAWQVVNQWLWRAGRDVEAAQQVMETEFKSRSLIDPGEFLHVFGLRLWLSSTGVLGIPRDEVVSQCKQYLDDLKAEGRLTALPRDAFRHELSTGSHGLAFAEADSTEFQDILEYTRSLMRQADRAQYPQRASELLREMSADSRLFYRRIAPSASDDGIYCTVPIFIAVAPQQFVDEVLRQPPGAQLNIYTALRSRYDSGSLNDHLDEEKPWIAQVKECFLKSATTLSWADRMRIEKLTNVFLTPVVGT